MSDDDGGQLISAAIPAHFLPESDIQGSADSMETREIPEVEPPPTRTRLGAQGSLDGADTHEVPGQSPSSRSSFLDASSVARIKTTLASYYERMRGQPGMNSHDDIRIRIAEVELISLLDFVEGIVGHPLWSDDEFYSIQKTEILCKLCTRIDLKEFPPNPFQVTMFEKDLFPVPCSDYIQQMKHVSKSSPISRVIRDMNAIEDRKRRYFHVKKLPYGIDTLVEVLSKLLPLHVIMSSPYYS